MHTNFYEATSLEENNNINTDLDQDWLDYYQVTVHGLCLAQLPKEYENTNCAQSERLIHLDAGIS